MILTTRSESLVEEGEMKSEFLQQFLPNQTRVNIYRLDLANLKSGKDKY